jgi:HSP20 family protein
MEMLTQWDPIRELEQMQGRLSRLYSRSPATADGGRELMAVAEWAPSVDIVENDSEWLVKAELPEVKREDVHVSIDRDVLSLAGERRLEKEEKGRRYHRIERSHGSFARSFTLPDGADAGKVSAEFKEGRTD